VTDPERLLKISPSAFEQTLIRAAAEEQPSDTLVRRMAVGLNLGDIPGLREPTDSVTGIRRVTQPQASSTAALASSATPASMLTWGAAAVLLGGTLFAGLAGLGSMLGPRDRLPNAPVPQLQVALPVLSDLVPETPKHNSLPSEFVMASEGLALATPSATEARPLVKAKPRATHALSPSSGRQGSGRLNQLRAEIDLLDSARSALEAGRGSDARGALTRYQERFSHPILGAEANALRRKLNGLGDSGE
jgi:hypothetical protein